MGIAKIVTEEQSTKRAGDFMRWLHLLRVHQYAKNVLVFVPLLAAHAFDAASIKLSIIAFIAFSLCASGVYIINDIVDLPSDRAHPTKKNRPLAKGLISIPAAAIASALLIASALFVAYMVKPVFAAILAGYFVLTTLYSFVLKRKMMVDVITLAGLYTMRVLGGAAIITVPVSQWLLAFSLFVFMSLALVKRYVELTRVLDADLPDPMHRAYKKDDLPVILALAVASGWNSIIVLALYMSSNTVTELYNRPELLWLVCPVFMYWISRILLLAHRKQMNEDPVVFTILDIRSLISGAIVLALGALAL